MIHPRIRWIIEYIYITPPAWMAPSKAKNDKERIKKLEDQIARIQALMQQVKSPVIAGKIQAMLDQVHAMMDAGNLSDAENAIGDIHKFAENAADVTDKLYANIQKAKSLMWALPPQLRGSLDTIIKGAEKALATGGDLDTLKDVSKAMEKVITLASKIADAGPGALHRVGAEVRELQQMANDVAPLGTDHLMFSDAMLKQKAEQGDTAPGQPVNAAKAADAAVAANGAPVAQKTGKLGKKPEKGDKPGAAAADAGATAAQVKQVQVPQR